MSERETKSQKDVAAAARHDAERLMGEATRTGRDLLTGQRKVAASEVDGIAKALRQTAQTLHGQQQDSIAYYADQAADGLSNLASSLRDREAADIGRQINDFARHNPGLFVGGAIAAGFLLARVLRGSSEGAMDTGPEQHAEPIKGDGATVLTPHEEIIQPGGFQP